MINWGHMSDQHGDTATHVPNKHAGDKHWPEPVSDSGGHMAITTDSFKYQVSRGDGSTPVILEILEPVILRLNLAEDTARKLAIQLQEAAR